MPRESVPDLAARLKREADAAALSARLEAAKAIVAPAPARSFPAAGLARVRDEAARRYGPGLFGLLLYQDDLLAAGPRPIHSISPWWRETFRAYFAARLSFPMLFWILAMVGRGGGKSTTLERLAIIVMLFAPRTMSSAEAWQWPFISIRAEDAARRIREIEKLINRAYGLDVKANSQNVIATEDASGNAIEFISLASTIGNVSGPSTGGCTVDEAGKLRFTGANPDAELIISLAETSRARDNWLGVRCSSAWLTRGAHHAAVVQGSNVVNFVATIGVAWIDVALEGYEEVARWEAAQGNREGAAQIRAWAKTLRASSPFVPTWVANNSIGALASRLLLETVPRDPGDEDIPIVSYWLRENGSMSLEGDGGFDPARQLDGLPEANAALCAVARGEPTTRIATGGDVGPMKVRGAPPGDARYAGPVNAGPWVPPGWDKGTVF